MGGAKLRVKGGWWRARISCDLKRDIPYSQRYPLNLGMIIEKRNISKMLYVEIEAYTNLLRELTRMESTLFL